jgi:hypothetical protein
MVAMRSFELNTIDSLISFIGKSLAEIESQLRANAALRRSTGSDDAQDQLQSEKIALTLAHAFKLAHPETTQWPSQFDCYTELTDWFSQECTFEHHKSFAMWCWYKLITIELKEMPASDLILLGEAFLPEPCKFAGYLLWVIENSSNESIQNALVDIRTLMQKYFAYHVHDLAQIHSTYALLRKTSPKMDSLLTRFTVLSCNLRGFINQKLPDGGFRSHNVLGNFFEHRDPIELKNTRLKSQLQPEIAPSSNQVKQLFRLFGWALIHQLNFKHERHISFVKNILDDIQSPFIFEFVKRALEGLLDNDSTMVLSRCITDHFESKRETLVNLHPFFIHTLIGRMSDSPAAAGNAIEKLLTEPSYKTISHVLLLTRLRGEIGLLPEKKAIKEKILDVIFDIITPYGNTLPDEIIFILRTIIFEFEPVFESKLGQLFSNLSAALTDLVENKIDYDALQLLWGNQLSLVNLIVYLCPEFLETISYPYTKYDLKILAVQKILEYSEEHHTEFELACSLAMMCATNEDRDRTLREILIKTNNDRLIEAILTEIAKKHCISKFVFEAFGEGKNILQHVFHSKKYALLNKIVSAARFPKHFIAKVARYAANQKEWLSFLFLCGISHYPIEKNRHIKKNNFTLLILVLKSISRENIRRLFSSSAHYAHYPLILKRITLTQPLFRVKSLFALLEKVFTHHEMKEKIDPYCYMGKNEEVARFVREKYDEYAREVSDHAQRRRSRSPDLFEQAQRIDVSTEELPQRSRAVSRESLRSTSEPNLFRPIRRTENGGAARVRRLDLNDTPPPLQP